MNRPSIETTPKLFDNPDFAAAVRETVTVSKPDGSKSSSRRVVPAEGATPAEFAKAIVLANARYGALMELPYLTEGIDDEAAEAWRCALTDDNPPVKVSFRRGKEGYPAFRELVVPLDFPQFDPVKAAEIRAMYATSGPAKREIDAEEIAQAELERESE